VALSEHASGEPVAAGRPSSEPVSADDAG